MASSKGAEQESLGDKNQYLLERVMQLQDRAKSLHTLAADVVPDAYTGYQSFMKKKYTSPFAHRNELLGVEDVELTPEEDRLVRKALDAEAIAKEKEESQLVAELREKLKATQDALAAAKAGSEEMVSTYTQELKGDMEKAQADHEAAKDRMNALEERNAELALAENHKTQAEEDLARVTFGTAVLPPFVRGKVIIIVGLGLIGQGFAELLIRSKMKKIMLIDSGDVDDADVASGPFFKQEDVGRSRVEVAAERIQRMGEVSQVVQGVAMGLSGPQDAGALADLLKRDGEVGLVVCCGSEEQSAACNQACLSCKQVWLEARVENAHTYHIMKLTPGEGACRDCLTHNPPDEDTNVNLAQIEPLAAAANAHALVWITLNEAVKHFVGVGRPYFCSAFSMAGCTERDMSPNPFCSNELCVSHQGGTVDEDFGEEEANQTEDDEAPIEGEDPDCALIRKARKAEARHLAVRPLQETKAWANEEQTPSCTYAPNKTVYPSASLLRNTILMDYINCYGALVDPLAPAEVDAVKLQASATAAPTPAYPVEERLAAGNDRNLADARLSTPSTPIQLEAMFTDKADMDFQECVVLTAIKPGDTAYSL